MILLLLFGRLIFELDYTIWRLFLEVILGIGCCYIYRFFRGIGDVSRIEKVSFEDDEYFYYVKAVPKASVATSERSIKKINAEPEKEERQAQEQVVSYANPILHGDDEAVQEEEEAVPVERNRKIEDIDFEKKLEESLKEL